ncbi:DNA-binding response regulator, OmpR family, contains REC and winged-helix (wHTH) domain [Eubacterium maltosivorans]|uniref:response regulator transcription factor n=1 Tax=Eubacterium maltosivorans TaxID=2041044 RepID=UPI00088C3FF1|nr:response regulator transcription factor [Eubacterium maltosivorans]WPK82313.1 Transcriptional regulatory protein SrrA [Eubacterium maltosivorans]SDO52917.1 DNA-binding response regulator, OmpR family, contains REC and winged-helix (wHTH) domain [Eubacterium maltosivorans]
MKKILIIEDDLKIAELERDYLEINGFQVELAADGGTGLSSAVNNDFDLIVLDLMLPGIDGFTICRSIREEKETPIIMVSAKRDDVDKVRGLGLGADDYMVKPFSPAELVARVKAHIARFERLTSQEKRERHHIIEINCLQIDKDARRVYLREKEVTLTNREFDLLLFMAENPNIVFNKETLFERVWGLDAVGDTTTVTVHVNRLREKIEIDNREPHYIETVWGAGYRFKI